MATVNIAQQGQLGAFVYSQNNLGDNVQPLGSFGYSIIQSLEKQKGDLSPINLPDPEIPNKFIIADTVRAAPGLGTATIIEKVDPNRASYLEEIYDEDCEQVMLIKIDCDGQKTDEKSFQSVYIVVGLQPTNLGHEGDLMSFTENADTGVQFTSEGALVTWARAFPILFSEYAGDEVLAEIRDIIYADQKSCGACAPYSKGNQKVYALARANTGSPGLSAQLIYTTDGRSTWTALDLQPLGGNDADRITSVGSFLVVVSEADGSHVYVPKANLTTSRMTRVTSGYQVGGAPRRIFPLSVGNVIIGGAGGYIYRATDITSSVSVVHDASLTTENCNDVHGIGNTVVSVHNNNTILLSNNGGKSFAALDGIDGESGENLLAVWVFSPTAWYIGSSSGKLYYTMDGGDSYTQRGLPRQDTIDAVLRINFNPDLENNQVGALAVQYTDNTGAVLRTLTGGRSWLDDDTSGIDGLPANERINAVVCNGVNEIAAAGKASGSTDGLIAIALK